MVNCAPMVWNGLRMERESFQCLGGDGLVPFGTLCMSVFCERGRPCPSRLVEA